MIKTDRDAPFGGFGDDPANPATTGQVMEFTVDNTLTKPADALVSNIVNIKPKAEPMNNAKVMITRQISLNEGESEKLCIERDAAGNVTVVAGSSPPECALGGEPFAPKEALLGTVDLTNPAAPKGIALSGPTSRASVRRSRSPWLTASRSR